MEPYNSTLAMINEHFNNNTRNNSDQSQVFTILFKRAELAREMEPQELIDRIKIYILKPIPKFTFTPRNGMYNAYNKAIEIINYSKGEKIISGFKFDPNCVLKVFPSEIIELILKDHIDVSNADPLFKFNMFTSSFLSDYMKSGLESPSECLMRKSCFAL